MRLAKVQSFVVLLSLLLASTMHAKPKSAPRPTMSATTPFSFQVTDIDGKNRDLADYRGKAVLIVNTASRCGFTPQYDALEAICARYHARGFEVLAFPANNFLGQEPGTNARIERSAARASSDVPAVRQGEREGQGHRAALPVAHEGFALPGDIPWNFTKFLVAPDGRVIARFAPNTAPDDPAVIAALEPACCRCPPRRTESLRTFPGSGVEAMAAIHRAPGRVDVPHGGPTEACPWSRAGSTSRCAGWTSRVALKSQRANRPPGGE
jgi:glutathione peroxidase